MNSPENKTQNSSGPVNVDIIKKTNKRKEKKHHKKKKRKSDIVHSELEIQNKYKHKKYKRHKEKKVYNKKEIQKNDRCISDDIPGPSVPVDLLINNSKSRAPMTKEEWEKSQNTVRRVYDEVGRSRLIKGDGEVIEEIVSKEKHHQINRQATLGDGLYFQRKINNEKR
ncbi:hypothetical protein PGB90_004477 [Kerria lacca]